ncbi:MAG: hypothetical protein A2X04_05115 [Bacteroidetes bacterium GWF2_41_9]|nr:MAG: hypothetical protein A2X03_03005 [Bacteroidetes bacterium GWA2_40_15]OFY00857.1 MAG: hypothetical protein A2X06_04930 [Bacteroidetes bacterium GWC2_40_22]OFY57076.1 MAG: hypothetical protein A2X04_05115 [Bacteroidetes bacterium GWF2_41_9]HAM10388.1 hypothetical protein [Bacteroidales bacterium]HBH83512.1 hypothetical protein [Bacteroidales bacterium]
MIRQVTIFLIFSLAACSVAISQEAVVGIQSNYSITGSSEMKSKSISSLSHDTIELPFFDDFSGKSIFPDSKKWADNFVFINNTYSDKQITAGVATFDAIDNRGMMYETAISSGFMADMLTSLPLNLNYTAADKIKFTFFFQAGGLGDSPEPNDSLTLQFLSPEENKWFAIWRVNGTTDQSFRQVLISIDDQRFLKKGFQFRFINYASISKSLNTDDQSIIGNCDHWNIDYVLLDKNREADDTVYSDVAIRSPNRSLLKNHEAMPLNHFREIELQEMSSFIPVYYRNNDIIVRNVTRNFEIWDVNKNTKVHSFTAGASNIDPLTNVDYKANLIYTFKSDSPDSARFRIISSLKTDDFDPKGNDTIDYYQVFRNYFAFDDGSAEMGYGINGQGSRNAMVAYRFNSYIPDTLRSIQICFNDSYNNANKRAFDLMVWDDDKGVPGNILYTGEEVMVEHNNRINGFYTYGITDGVPVDGVFYIGWKQRSETFLNAGFDINTPNKGRQLFWLNGEWLQSQTNGTLMIRPVVGVPEKTTSINDLYNRKLNSVLIRPNPASNYITVITEGMTYPESSRITILDLNGRELMNCRNEGEINISSLRVGIYIVIISTAGKPTGYSRLIKVR